jgi:hypothetical protein
MTTRFSPTDSSAGGSLFELNTTRGISDQAVARYAKLQMWFVIILGLPCPQVPALCPQCFVH